MNRNFNKRILSVWALLVLFLVGCKPAPPPPPVVMNKFLFDPATKALCNDGTAAGYYFREGKGTSGGKNKWVIYLEGGGFCENKDECSIRDVKLTSSNSWAATKNTDGILSDNNSTDNPDYYDANHVYLPYCSSDFWSGDRDASIETNNWHFKGNRILQVLMDKLIAERGLKDNMDTTILLVGTSAGGMGAMINLDILAQRAPNAKWFGINDAGWIADVESFNGAKRVITRIKEGRVFWNAQLSSNCTSSFVGSEERCYLGADAYPHIIRPLFVESNQLDPILLKYHNLNWPYITPEQQHYKNCVYAPAILSSLTSVSGAFVPAMEFVGVLPLHGVLPMSFFWSVKYNGQSTRTLLKNWMSNSGAVTKVVQPVNASCI
ncbi:MAG: hypothetical protein HQK49_21875 [Oligoflexia bacterium]|nr:hypothetical protein [Oligoflexia bacterium]